MQFFLLHSSLSTNPNLKVFSRVFLHDNECFTLFRYPHFQFPQSTQIITQQIVATYNYKQQQWQQYHHQLITLSSSLLNKLVFHRFIVNTLKSVAQIIYTRLSFFFIFTRLLPYNSYIHACMHTHLKKSVLFYNFCYNSYVLLDLDFQLRRRQRRRID